jgi:hypothetical protein
VPITPVNSDTAVFPEALYPSPKRFSAGLAAVLRSGVGTQPRTLPRHEV